MFLRNSEFTYVAHYANQGLPVCGLPRWGDKLVKAFQLFVDLFNGIYQLKQSTLLNATYLTFTINKVLTTELRRCNHCI